MKKLFEKLLCAFGRHDWELLPSPPGVMSGIFGPHKCRRCPKEVKGFPYPKFPPPPWKGKKMYDHDNKLKKNIAITDEIKKLLYFIENAIGDDYKSIDDITDLIDSKDYQIGHLYEFSITDLEVIKYSLNKMLESVSLKSKFLKIIGEQNERHFISKNLSEKAMFLAIDSLMALKYPPETVLPTEDNSISFRYDLCDKHFELEFFPDGDIVFVHNDTVMDIPYEQLEEKISIINEEYISREFIKRKET